MTVEIRTATLADVPVIAQFNICIAQETENHTLDPDRITRGVAALVSDPAKGIYYVAVVEREVVGQVLITCEWSDWRNGTFWWLQSVYVKREFRARGIFKALFAHVFKLARQRQDVCGLRLYMHRDNATARQAYERLGMQQTNYQVFEMGFSSGRSRA